MNAETTESTGTRTLPKVRSLLFAGALIVATCSAHSWIYFNHKQMVSADGGPWMHFGFAALYMAAMLALFFIGLPAGLFLAFRQKTRTIGLLLLLGIAANIGSHLFFRDLGMDYRMEAFRDLGERSMPLINAIKAYEAHEGRPPDSLDTLVPEYIGEIPKTGMGAYPEFEYLTGEDATRPTDNPWEVRIHSTRGGITFAFVYVPNQEYPDSQGRNFFKRLGEWAYYQKK